VAEPWGRESTATLLRSLMTDTGSENLVTKRTRMSFRSPDGSAIRSDPFSETKKSRSERRRFLVDVTREWS